MSAKSIFSNLPTVSLSRAQTCLISQYAVRLKTNQCTLWHYSHMDGSRSVGQLLSVMVRQSSGLECPDRFWQAWTAASQEEASIWTVVGGGLDWTWWYSKTSRILLRCWDVIEAQMMCLYMKSGANQLFDLSVVLHNLCLSLSLWSLSSCLFRQPKG